MLRQLLTSGNERRDSLKRDGFFTEGSAFLLPPPNSDATDLTLEPMPSTLSFEREASGKGGVAYLPSYSLELCPNELVVKNEGRQRSLAVLANMPPGSCCFQQPSSGPIVMRYPSEDLNGTTELFSSTFAMLSSDGTVPESEWGVEQQPESKLMPVMYALNNSQAQATENNQTFMQQAVPFSIPNDNGSSRANQSYLVSSAIDSAQSQANQQIFFYQTQSSAESAQQPVIVCSEGGSGYLVKSEKPAGISCAQSFQELAHMAVSSGTSSGRNTPLLENEDGDERVMCMACRGVYPSRRSLTGHIGRNEKCREIIGRNYLDQVGGTTDKISVLGSPAGPVETISPICPYCDRFISHYKGNIRRHINQCLKTDRSKSKKQKKQERLDAMNYSENGFSSNGYSNSNDSCYDGYQPRMLTSASGDFQWDEASLISNGYLISQPSPPPQISKDGKNNDDPYLCSVCDFVTVYKGNMKRHLSTCHSITESDLGEGGLESLRASRKSGDTKSRIGKVSRGRRPKSVQLQDECRKKAKLESRKCFSPVSSENASLGAETKSPNSVEGNISESFCVDSNSNSSMHEHFSSEITCQSESEANDLSSVLGNDFDTSNVYISQEQKTKKQSLDNYDSVNAASSGDNELVLDERNHDTGSSDSKNNIDEIINAVASNQLGKVARKSSRQSKLFKSGGRRSALPKTVSNMDEVRDYWEAERLSSGSTDLPAVYFARSRNSQFAAISSQLATNAVNSTHQH